MGVQRAHHEKDLLLWGSLDSASGIRVELADEWLEDFVVHFHEASHFSNGAYMNPRALGPLNGPSLRFGSLWECGLWEPINGQPLASRCP